MLSWPPMGSRFRGKQSWTVSDNEKRFFDNLKCQPDGWRYRFESVEYSYGPQGFRCIDINEIDWQNSVVMLGCSTTFGDGVDDNHTVTRRLQELIGIPVINLGICGAGPVVMRWLVQMILLQDHLPKHWILAWPTLNRTALFLDTQMHPLVIGPWVKTGPVESWQMDFYANWIRHNNSENQSMMEIQNTRLMLKLISASVTEITWSSETASRIGCKQILPIDRARDLAHPGPDTMMQAAHWLNDQIDPNL